MIEYINAFEELENKKISMMGRASNLFWIGFGKMKDMNNKEGKKVVKSEYALHIQSSWKFVDEKEKKILVASNDIYQPREENNWADNFNWEKKENNLFDEKIGRLNLESLEVKNIEITSYSDLTISFSNFVRLLVFSDSSTNEEIWRFFKPGQDTTHYIGTGKGIIKG